MFRVKICGITSVENAVAVADAGADAIGLNFYAHSRRRVTPEIAAEIVSVLPRHVTPIALFVNETVDEIQRIAQQTGISIVQLHGEEPAALVKQLEPLRIVRAFPCPLGDLAPAQAFLNTCAAQNCEVEAILLDSFKTGERGGTGLTIDWATVANWRKELPLTRLILAGGLTPQNVQPAILEVRPDAVDSASGVESAPGIKDPDLVRQFVRAAQEAFAICGS